FRDADAGGLLLAHETPRRAAARPRAQELYGARELVRPALLQHGVRRPAAFRLVDLEHGPAAQGLPAAPGYLSLAACDRAAAGIATHGYRTHDRGHRRALAPTAGSQERLRRRRTHTAGLGGNPQGLLDHQLHSEIQTIDQAA